VARRLEREHVRELVPQRRAPVEVRVRARRGAVHRDQVAERHAEEPDTGQTGGPHREVVVLGIELDDHGFLELEAFPGPVIRESPVEPLE